MYLPILSSEGNLSFYLQEIKKFPLLSAEEEFMLAKRYQKHDDAKAAHKLVTSHLRLVDKIAMGYLGYGLPINDLISEWNVGIMQAVKIYNLREVDELIILDISATNNKKKIDFKW